MTNSNYRKHARKVSLDSAINNAIEKAVDARKVAAFTVGAAGVLAGAAFAFGATPAMAAEAGAAADTNTAPVTAGEKAGKKADGENADGKADAKSEAKETVAKETEAKETAKQEQAVDKDQTEANKEAGDKAGDTNKQTEKKSENTVNTDGTEDKSTVVNIRSRRSLPDDPSANDTATVQDRAEGDSASQDPNKIKPDTTNTTNTKISIDENNAETMPNMYGWGSSDNTYSVNGETHTVTFNFAKPTDGGKITNIAIFPAQNNGLTNDKSKRGAEYYSGDAKMHQSFSGNYKFNQNNDGSATLTMSNLFRDGNLNGGAEAYAANRSIFVYVTEKDGTTTIYKTNAFRAATLVPPKTAGSVVLKYNQPLTKEQIQAAITAAANAETARKDKKSVNDQLSAASTSKGVFTRENGKAVQVADTLTDKINEKSADAYDKTMFAAINAKKAGDDNTYVVGAKTLNTYMVTDLGFKSQAIPLTVARYDTRIDKPIVDDLSKVSDEVKTEIKRKLAHLNNVSLDQVTINDQGEFTINFAGVDPKDAPKIALRDLVLKKIEEKDVIVPSDDKDSKVKAVVVANPLGYSNAELDQIKKAIYEANRDNQELGLTSVDQISLGWISGDLTQTGDTTKGISNGQSENTITVTIKTDKAYAQFKSNIKEHRLTRLIDLRKDYKLSWEDSKNKIDGRTRDEGLAWMEDGKTLVYRYDPDSGTTFNTKDVLGLLKATVNADVASANPQLRKEILGSEYETVAREGKGGKGTRSHAGYAVDNNGNPIGVLNLSKLNGSSYGGFAKPVDNSNKKMGDEQSSVNKYTFDNDSQKVSVAGKKDKCMIGRLFIEPYTQYQYNYIYGEDKYNPRTSPKGINVVFVPQTNHKTSDLKKSVLEHKTIAVEGKDVPTQPAYYNASKDKKDAYDKALQTAKTLLDSVKDKKETDLNEEQKAQIDNATINLNKARAELDGAKTDKNGLTQSIEANGKAKEGQTAEVAGTVTTDRYKNVTDQAFQTDDGKPDTKKNEAAKKAKEDYDKALEEAKKLKDDANATQKAVDEAKAKLDAARKELDKYSTNKDKLNAAIAEHGKVKDGRDAHGTQTLANADPAYQNATEKERKAYDAAVKKANDLSADPNASQKEVNEAITALEAAKAKLDAKATNKTKLAVAVQQTFDNPNPNDANGKKSTFYKNALGKKNSTAPNVTQEQKNAAEKAINDYDQALAKAKELLEDKNGKATQAQVDAAVKALTEAEDKLHEGYSTDKNDLTKALADNIDGYLKPAYFNAFDKAQAGDEAAKQAFKEYNDAYHAAKDLKTRFASTDQSQQPTDAECKAAKEALEKARQVIDTYATDTSKLSAAFWNDLAIQNSPAYKNAKALAGKQSPTSEEQAQVEAAKKIKQAYDDAVAKLHKAFSNTLDQDKDAKGTPFTKIPDAKGDPTSKNYLDGVQAHANGEPLDRDVTDILTAMNDAADQLKQFATKTDKLQESINKDTDTQKNPAYKNARDPHKLGTDGKEDTSGYDAIKEKAKAYDDALKAAKALMIKPDATQEDVNAALKKLDDARKALNAYKTNVDELKKNVEAQGSTDGPAVKEGTVTSDAYRNASDPHFLTADGKPDEQKNTKAAAAKKAYDEALTKAQELLKKHDDKDTPQDAKPIQKEIDAALTTLNEKRKALDAYKTDTTKLDGEAKKSTAEGATVADADFEATPEFKNAKAKTSNGVENTDVTAYKKALKDARDLVKAATSTDPNTKNSDRPTQQQVDEALASLKKAKKQIEDNYKTNLEPLTSAKDFADGDFKKTPEYKNAVAKKTAGDPGATQALGETGKNTGFDNVLAKVAAKLNDNDWKQKATQKQVNALLKQLQDAQEKIAKDYKTDALKLEREVGDKDQDGKPVVPPFEASVPYKNALAKADAGDNDATTKLKDYNDKLKAAQDLIAQVNSTDPNADPDKKPTQAQVDAALKALQDAKKAIKDSFTTSAKDLKTEADKSKEDGEGASIDGKFENTTEFKNADSKKGEDGKDNADITAYKEALTNARTLLGKFDENGKPKADAKDIPSQKEVDEALKNLKEIKEKIKKNYVTSPHDLQDEVDKSKDGEDDTSTDVFENTPAFKNATAKGDEAAKNALKDYNDNLAAAKALLDKFDRTTGKPRTDLPSGTKVPTQQELDDALKALQAAKKKIENDYSTVKYDLRQEAGDDFTKSPEYQNAQAKGDDASKQALDEYKNALDEANSVLADPNATQAEVDVALKKLKAAKDKLRDENSTDKSKLQTEADADASFRKSVYFIIGNKADIEAYENALAEARSVLADPNATQAQVDEALRKLQAAKYKLNHPFGTGSGSGIGSGYDPNAGDGFAVEISDSQSASVDKSALQIEVNNAVDTNANTAAARAYRQALAEARRVLADENATQAQVDAALRNLKAARAALLNSLRGASGASGLKLAKTGAETSMFASIAAAFAGFGVAGVASRRRKHSNE